MLNDSIIAKINAMDLPSFDLMFKEIFPHLLLYTEKVTQDTIEAEDIALMAFAKLWEVIKLQNKHFNSLAQIRSYLYTVARNQAISYLRKLAASKNYKNAATLSIAYVEQISLERYIYEAAILQKLYEEIEKLPEKCQQVFKLCYFTGMSREQAANQLGISRKTVDCHCRTGMDKLKNIFSDHDLLLLLVGFSASLN